MGDGSGLHIENRFPGGDMNPYLAYAAVLGAGLLGIEREIEPPGEYNGNGYVATGCDRMPRALHEAIRELEASEAAADIFGADVVAHYLNAARVEQETYDAIVHPGTASATWSAARGCRAGSRPLRRDRLTTPLPTA